MHTFTPTRRLALVLAALSAGGTLYAQQSPPISIGPGNAPAPASMSDNPATDATPGATDDSSQQAPLSVEDLDTLLAPVALYPDSLLSQVLMAATYPLEVVQANRWLQANATLTGDALADALNQQSWDPSVKSLVNTPSVLQMMDDKLDWTIRLGDAFLAQQADVMNSVQRLRAQAQQAGTLRSTAQQNITYENAYNDGATNPPVPQYIEIQETSPQYVYVPVYDPFVVYGNWRYRTHPWFWHPHNYVPTNGIWFGDRYTCGPAWGYAWGEPDWARHDLDLDPHRHSTLNPRFDSDRYIDQHYRHDRDNDGRDNRGRNNDPRGGRDRGPGDRGAPNRDHRDDNNSRVNWRHDPTHRRGVAYPDATTAQRFGRPAQLPNAASPRLPNTVSPNLPNTVSPRLPNTVSPNLPNAASPRLPNASATPDADHRGSAPVRPQDPRRDLPIQNNPRDRNNGTPDNDTNRPDRSNDDRSHDDRSTPDRPNGDHSKTDRPNTPTRGTAPDAGQPRDDRNVHPIRPSDRTTGAGNASDTPPAPVPPKPKPAPEPAPTPPTLPKPTPTQPPAPQDTPRRVVPQPTPPQAPQPQVPQAPQPQVPQPAAPRREAPHDAPRHEAPAAPAPAAPTPDVPAAPARGGPHGSAGASDAPAPAPAAPSNAPAAGPHGGR